jgi:hypothetical protein
METDLNMYNCPHCKSENTRKLSLIHKDGISHTSGTVSTTKSFGSFSSSSQTSSSYNAAPPKDLGLFLVQRIMIGVLLWLGSVFIMVNYIITIIDSILKAIFLGFLLIPVHILELGAIFIVVPFLTRSAKVPTLSEAGWGWIASDQMIPPQVN